MKKLKKVLVLPWTELLMQKQSIILLAKDIKE